MMKSEIGAEIEDQCTHSLLTEKRKHAEVGDGSPPSKQPPPPPEKRNCVEHVEEPPESLPPFKCRCQGRGEYDGPTFDELPPFAQKPLMQFMEMFGPKWPRSGWGSHHISHALIGELGPFIDDDDLKQAGSAGRGEISHCCSNPMEPLNFKENHGFYCELRVFAEKSVAYCNAKFKTTLCFEDIEKVTSCQSHCGYYLVTNKVVDPCNKISVVVLRGKVRGSGFAEAKVEDFVIVKP